MSIILQVVECGGLASAEHNPGALCCKPQLHQQDKLLRVFTKVDMDSDTGGAEFQAAAFGGYASASISSEQSPSLKESFSLSLDASRVEAQDDVSYVSNELAIEDALSNLDIEAKPRNRVDKLLLCDLLVDKGSQEETACHCRTSHASTQQGAQCHMAALWSTGRPQRVSMMEPSTCRLQPGMRIILQVVECGELASAEHNPGVLGCKPQLHLQDKLLRVFTKTDMGSDTGGAEIQAAAFGGYAR
ncbi:hypothetical protein HPB52_019041 [Rhipicephalus sanguineus]|uniref:Uncharacterized protein n=1 Tax=Rhipicephalus sanguineus TaxID=34632 RepID=A0A9D4TB93_RHISA|nr:hypothetical protein HPB52_019041 [Rhipicephalus sanguineus]